MFKPEHNKNATNKLTVKNVEPVSFNVKSKSHKFLPFSTSNISQMCNLFCCFSLHVVMVLSLSQFFLLFIHFSFCVLRPFCIKTAAPHSISFFFLKHYTEFISVSPFPSSDPLTQKTVHKFCWQESSPVTLALCQSNKAKLCFSDRNRSENLTHKSTREARWIDFRAYHLLI